MSEHREREEREKNPEEDAGDASKCLGHAAEPKHPCDQCDDKKDKRPIQQHFGTPPDFCVATRQAPPGSDGMAVRKFEGRLEPELAARVVRPNGPDARLTCCPAKGGEKVRSPVFPAAPAQRTKGTNNGTWLAFVASRRADSDHTVDLSSVPLSERAPRDGALLRFRRSSPPVEAGFFVRGRARRTTDRSRP